MVLAVIDTEEHVERLRPILDETLLGGLVTMEKAHALLPAPAPKRAKGEAT
jgi:PII-like signaling protein